MRALCALVGVMLTLGISVSGASGATTDESGFFIRKDEGWFWYHDPLVEAEPLQGVIAETPPSAANASKREKNSASELPPLSAAWLSAQLPQYLNVALDDPSPENVAAYLYLQRYTLDKSTRFADAAELAVMADPFLDENTRRPISTFGAQARTRVALEALDATLVALAEHVGLYFFYRSDCPYCAAQVPILQAIEDHYGLHVMAVSLDHHPLPGDPFPGYVSDHGQAAYLNVVATPALFLVKPQPNREVVQISQGLLSLSEFKDRVVKLAHDAGWIDDAEFERTQPYANVVVAGDPNLDQPTEELLEDPARLVAFLRSRITR